MFCPPFQSIKNLTNTNRDSGVANPKAFTVSHLVTPKQAWPQASHQLNLALITPIKTVLKRV